MLCPILLSLHVPLAQHIYNSAQFKCLEALSLFFSSNVYEKKNAGHLVYVCARERLHIGLVKYH